MNETFRSPSIVLPQPCCNHLEQQSHLRPQRKEQEMESSGASSFTILLVSLMIPSMNKREIRVNSPSKCSVNGRYAVGIIKIQLIYFYSFELDKMHPNRLGWLVHKENGHCLFGSVSAAEKCLNLRKPKEVSKSHYCILVPRNVVSFMKFSGDIQLTRQCYKSPS